MLDEDVSPLRLALIQHSTYVMAFDNDVFAMSVCTIRTEILKAFWIPKSGISF